MFCDFRFYFFYFLVQKYEEIPNLEAFFWLYSAVNKSSIKIGAPCLSQKSDCDYVQFPISQKCI